MVLGTPFTQNPLNTAFSTKFNGNNSLKLPSNYKFNNKRVEVSRLEPDVLKQLYDNLSKDQITIDMVEVDGPAFKDIDNRLLSLILVKERMTELA